MCSETMILKRIAPFLLILLDMISCFRESVPDLDQLRSYQAGHDISQSQIRTGSIKRGFGLFQALKSVGVNGQESLDIINQLRDKLEFSHLKVGDTFSAEYTHNGDLIGFRFNTNPAEGHVLYRTVSDKRWQYQFKELPTEWNYRIIEGQLRAGSTLQADLLNRELSPQVVGDIINILLCKVHFRLDARTGDKYKVLLNERYFGDKILETKVLFTSYEGKKAGQHQAFLYEDFEEKSTYTAHYTDEGEALIRAGLRYPVKRLHIRSHYGHRRHPVTGKRSMHRGVDLRGRVGDPVFAVARGRVVESKWTSLGGNKIAVRHTDHSISYYLHLNKRLVKVGQRVKAYQKIGEVGATGRVTGPHLHFGFRKANGRWMNPMHKRMIATPKLSGRKFARLQKQILRTKVIMNAVEEGHLSENRTPARTIDANLKIREKT